MSFDRKNEGTLEDKSPACSGRAAGCKSKQEISSRKRDGVLCVIDFLIFLVFSVWAMGF